jgi:hypothetical protein
MIANREAVTLFAMTPPFMPRLATLAVLGSAAAPSSMTMPAGAALTATTVTPTVNLYDIICSQCRDPSIELRSISGRGCRFCK